MRCAQKYLPYLTMRPGLHLRAGRIGSRGSACRLRVGHVRIWLAPPKRGAGATLHTMCLHEAVSRFLVLCLGSGLALHHAPKDRVGLLVHGRTIKSVAVCVWVLGGPATWAGSACAWDSGHEPRWERSAGEGPGWLRGLAGIRLCMNVQPGSVGKVSGLLSCGRRHCTVRPPAFCPQVG